MFFLRFLFPLNVTLVCVTTVLFLPIFQSGAFSSFFCFSFACVFFVRVCEHISAHYTLPLCGSFPVSLHFILKAECFSSLFVSLSFFPSACSFVSPLCIQLRVVRLSTISSCGLCASFTLCFLPDSTECFCSSLSLFFVASFVDEEELLRRNRKMRILVVWYISAEIMHAHCVFPFS